MQARSSNDGFEFPRSSNLVTKGPSVFVVGAVIIGNSVRVILPIFWMAVNQCLTDICEVQRIVFSARWDEIAKLGVDIVREHALDLHLV